MSPLLLLGVALAGGAGAGLRYGLDLAITRWWGDAVPWGVLVVNLTGAFALGVLSAGVVDVTGSWLWGVGLLGGYTTFSSVAVSTVLLAEDRRARAATAYAVGTFIGSVAAAAAGGFVGSLPS